MKTLPGLLARLVCSAISASGAVPDLALSISTPRAIIGVTDDFIIVAALTNRSEYPVGLDFGDSPLDYVIELHDGAGGLVPDSAFGRRTKGAVFLNRLNPLMAPGAVTNVKIDIGEYFDIPGPGTYSVKLSRAAQYNNGRLESNVVVVTVLPRAAGTSADARKASDRTIAPGSVTTPQAIAGSGPASLHIGIVIDVDRATVLTAKPIQVHVKLTNPPPMDYSLPSEIGSFYNVDVLQSDGQKATRLHPEVPNREWQTSGPASTSAPRNPAAGNYVGLDVTKSFDMTEPGVYYVQAWIKVPQQFGGGELRSNMLTVTILPR